MGRWSATSLDEAVMFAMKTTLLTLGSILLIGFTLTLGKSIIPPRNAGFEQVLTDQGSEIEVVVCSATSARNSSLRNSELVANIVNGLSPNTHVLILVNDLQAFKAPSNHPRVTFIEVPANNSISIWPQDPFVVVQNHERTRLVVPNSFDREDDRIMPEVLGEMLDIEVIRSELNFEGGNLVSDSDAVFTGMNTIQTNVAQLHETPDQIQQRFERTLGRPLIVVGENQPSVPHLDLIVTPLGKKRVAIADSRQGAELAEALMQTSAAEISNFERQCENLFFGRADIQQLQDVRGNCISRPELVNHTHRAVRASLLIADELDALSQDFIDLGYQVLRVPALIPDLKPQLTESGQEKPGYPFLTYNNVLLEERDGKAIVYLPQYGLPTMDTAAVECWEKLGYEAKPIDGFATSSMYGGSLRCCTKVLSRKTH